MIAQAPSFWRKEAPELDTAGDLVKGGLWPSQRAWWDLPNFARLLVGGYGCGKSLTLCKWITSMALENAPVPCQIVSPTYTLLEKTIIETLTWLLDGKSAHYPGMSWIWRAQKKTFFIRFPGIPQARIYLASGDNPLLLKGPNLAAAGIDEPFIQEEEVLTQMIARVRHPKARRLGLGMTGTPEQLNWGFDLAEGEKSGTVDLGYVRMSTRENLTLAKTGYVERLEQKFDKRTAQAYIEGEFLDLTTGQVYHSFERVNNVCTIPMPDHAELGFGIDFNVNPMAACVFWRTEDHIHYFDEFELPNSDTPTMCAVLRDKYPALRECYPDSNAGRSTNAPGGKTDYNYIEQYGFNVNRFPTGNPLRRDRFNTINGMMAPVRGRVRMTFDPGCKKLIRYSMAYSHELMHKKEHKRMSHLMDARDYPAVYLFEIKTGRDGMVRTMGT